MSRGLRVWPFVITGLALVLVFSVGMLGSRAQEFEEIYQGPATPNALGPAIPPEVTDFATDWPMKQGDLAAHRAAADSPLDATSAYGAISAAPIVVGETVYIQDMQSNVFALDRESGEVKWEHRYDTETPGPNGVAIGYGMIYGSLGNTGEVFALDAETGEEVWRNDIGIRETDAVTMVPTVYDSTVYIGTVPGYTGGGRGFLHALDAMTGHVIWSFETVTDNVWGAPRLNSGGGVWYPLSIDDQGNLYFGTGNPSPLPGTEDYPNGSSRPGDNDYTSSMVSLDPETGAVRWYHNAKPHDLFDLDFQLTPIIATAEIDGTDTKVAIGGGKTGTVVAVNADTGEVLWEAEVGIHQNDDLQEIPEGETIEVYPGSLGGVETPMAYADGTIFVPVVNLSTDFTASTWDIQGLDITRATGELVALNVADGSVKWQVELPQMQLAGATVANDVVFTGGLDGVVRAHQADTGDELWTFQAGAGLNAPIAVAGDLVVVPAGGPFLPPTVTDVDTTVATPVAVAPAPEQEDLPPQANEVIAFRLPSGEATPEP